VCGGRITFFKRPRTVDSPHKAETTLGGRAGTLSAKAQGVGCMPCPVGLTSPTVPYPTIAEDRHALPRE